jgi:site-specific recombinase XerD
MLSNLFPKAFRRYLSLPVLGAFTADFETWLLERGYARGSRERCVRALVQIDHFLHRRETEVTHAGLEVCWRWYRRRDPEVAGTVRSLTRFLDAHGHLPARLPDPPTQTDACVAAYAAALRDLRGLAPKTIRHHLWTAREFLAHVAYEHRPGCLATVTAREVETFVCRVGTRLSRASLQHTVAELRSFLRFLATQGRMRPGLDAQIDTPRCYRQEQLPRALPWETVRAFLAAIDRRTPLGLRDYTIFFLIATYGLRASEIVTLTLESLNWRAGVLHVPARKHGTPLDLPLTDAVGTVLVRYLRSGRPATERREVFLRGRAPAGALKPTAITEAFQAWARRSGLGIPFQGPHCLRHSLAVHLLRQGVSLKALGDLLGHRTAESTAAYLRLAVDDLRDVALGLPAERAGTSGPEVRS